MKIIDKLRSFNDELYFSFEFFPPKTQSGAENLCVKPLLRLVPWQCE